MTHSANVNTAQWIFAVDTQQLLEVRNQNHNLLANEHCGLEKIRKILSIVSNIDFMRHQLRSITPGSVHFYPRIIIPTEPSLARSPHHLI